MFFFFLCVEIPAAQQLSVYQPQMVQPGMIPQGLQVHKCYLYAEKHSIILLCASVHEKWFHEFCRMDSSQQVHTKLSRNRWPEECSNPCTQVRFATHLYVVKIDHCYRYYYHHDGNSGNLILNKNNDNLKGAGQPHEQSKTSLCTIIFFINTCVATMTTPPPSFSLHT